MRSHIASLALVALTFVPVAAHAVTVIGPDTVAVDLPDVTIPALALDPATDAPHLVYTQNGTLRHAWKIGGAWSFEDVASGLPWDATLPHEGGDLQVAPNGEVLALFRDGGRLVCAQRVNGIWLSDSLDAMPGIGAAAIALSPVTGEPVVVWAKRQGGQGTPLDVKLARRAAGVWTTQLLDTSSASQARVAVAVDHADRPRVAWGRPRADAVNARVLMCALASGPSGPFTAAVVDSALTGFVSLAVDPTNGDPRVAYNATPQGGFASLHYAALDGGTWQSVHLTGASTASPPSLVVDANGSPSIAITEITNVVPQDIRAGGPEEQQGCFYFQTGAVCLWRRASPTGSGSFARYQCLSHPFPDLISGVRAAASPQPGHLAVAWRSPRISCSPYDIEYAVTVPNVAVVPGVGARVALLPLAPNPIREGELMRVRFALERAAEVEFELHDAAGRSVATRAWGRLGAGSRELYWAPPVARPGLYWLSVRAGGEKIGTRATVVVR